MSESKFRKKKTPKRVLALPDLEQTKTAVLNARADASIRPGRPLRTDRPISASWVLRTLNPHGGRRRFSSCHGAPESDLDMRLTAAPMVRPQGLWLPAESRYQPSRGL